VQLVREFVREREKGTSRATWRLKRAFSDAIQRDRA
jgi:hypothetical protein